MHDEVLSRADVYGPQCPRLASNAAFSTEPAEIILIAIMHSFAGVFEDRSVQTFFEDHGRESWDADVEWASSPSSALCPFPETRIGIL